jgi:hypothetical protein
MLMGPLASNRSEPIDCAPIPQSAQYETARADDSQRLKPRIGRRRLDAYRPTSAADSQLRKTAEDRLSRL